MNFIVAYDVGLPKRLRQVAKAMQGSARRVQKSVFVFTGSRRELDNLLKQVLREIDPATDRVQAWPVRTSSRAQRVDLGQGLPDSGVAVVISPERCLVIEAIDDKHPTDHEPLVI